MNKQEFIAYVGELTGVPTNFVNTVIRILTKELPTIDVPKGKEVEMSVREIGEVEYEKCVRQAALCDYVERHIFRCSYYSNDRSTRPLNSITVSEEYNIVDVCVRIGVNVNDTPVYRFFHLQYS